MDNSIHCDVATSRLTAYTDLWYNPPMNSEETVLNYLAKQNTEVTREDIQEATGYANGSLKNALARLTANNRAIQSKGTYRITPLGRESLADPSNFAASFIAPKAKKKVIPLANVIEQLMDWDEAQTNELVRGALQMPTTDEAFQALIKPLVPLVVLYMKLVGIEFPEVTREVALIGNEEELADLYETFLGSIQRVLGV